MNWGFMFRPRMNALNKRGDKMKPEKDKRFARWLVKVLVPGYHLQRDRETGKKAEAKDVYPVTEE